MTPTARRLLVVVALGVAGFAALSIASDVGALGDRLAGFGWGALAGALGLAVLNYALRFVRWQLYLRGGGLAVPPGRSALVFVSGFALSVTPGKLGELIKSYLLRQTDGIPISVSAPIVIAERVTDLLALLVLGLAGVLAYGVAATMVLAGFAVVAAGLLVLAWPALANRLIGLATAPARLRRFRARLLELHGNLGARLRPWPLAWASALATLAWLAECFGFALIVGGFPGTAVPLGLAILIYAATTILGALSFLPGGILVTEAGMVALLVGASAGVDQSTAAAATILTRLATLWFAVGLGVGALALLRRRAPGAADVLTAGPGEPG